jgi:hypothetical protein
VAIHRISDAAALSRILLARGWQGLCPLPAALAHLQQSWWHLFRLCLLAVAVASLYRDRLCTYTIRPWVGRRQQPELPGVSVWRFSLSCRFPSEEHLFPQQKAVSRGFFLWASTEPFRSPYCSRATPRVCLCDALSLSRRLDLLEARFWYVSAWSPVGRRLDLPWRSGGFARSCSGRGFLWQSRHLVFTSSPWICSPETWCSSSYAPRRIFLLWIPVHHTRLYRRHVFAFLRHDFVSASSPTRRSGACETWVPMGPHRPGS